jgi:ATP-dependent DNA ligase
MEDKAGGFHMRTLMPPSRCTSSLPDDLGKDYLVGEEKLDGSRYVLYLGGDPYERQRKHALLSRRVSTVDSKHVDRTSNVPHITGLDYRGLEGTTLDGEIQASDFLKTNSIMNSSPALAIQKQKEIGLVTYHVFDVTEFRGKDVRGLPLEQRRKILEEVCRRMNNPNVKPIEQVRGDLQAYFNRIVAGGGEGIVIKDLRCGYGIGWSKYKRSADVSCILTGFKPGNGKYAGSVGSIAVSVYIGEELVEIGFASGFDDELRHKMSKNPSEYLGRVVDIHAQEIQKKGNPRLRHPTFARMRDDFTPTDCTIEKVISDLETKINRTRRDHD